MRDRDKSLLISNDLDSKQAGIYRAYSIAIGLCGSSGSDSGSFAMRGNSDWNSACAIPCAGMPQASQNSAFSLISAPQHPQ